MEGHRGEESIAEHTGGIVVDRDRLADLIKIEMHILGCWYVCEREMMCVCMEEV